MILLIKKMYKAWMDNKICILSAIVDCNDITNAIALYNTFNCIMLTYFIYYIYNVMRYVQFHVFHL